MEFITTDGKLIVDGKNVTQKRLTNTHHLNIYMLCFFFLFIVNQFIDNINNALETGKSIIWIRISILGLILLIYVVVFLNFLFRQYFKKKMDLSKIDIIKITQSDEGLETRIKVIMQSKRYKLYIFRTLEKQHDSFIETIHSLNPKIQLVTE